MEISLILIPLFAVVGLLYFGIRKMLVSSSGWEELAFRYRAPRQPDDWTWNHRTDRVGKVRFRRSMNVAVEAGGLYLAEAGIRGLATLYVPWSALGEPVAGRLYSRPSVKFTVGEGTVEFPLDLYNAIRLQCEGKRGRRGLLT